MKYAFLFYVFIVLILFSKSSYGSTTEKLEEVNEEELLQLVKDEKYVLILFMKDQQCKDTCQEFEKHLLGVREELAEAVGAWVIRSHAPSVLSSWGVGPPAPDTVAFVRHGKPMLLPVSLRPEDETLLEFLLANRQSDVLPLSDDTFEGTTQASTGATTGDWLVMFTRGDCEACNRSMPHLEAVASNLRKQKNVAHICREEGGGVTTRRFGVTHFPSVILFRLGRMYRYGHSSMKFDDLTMFALQGFRQAKVEEIPKPKTSFDDVTQAAADWLRENPYRFLAGVGGLFLVILVLVLLNSPPPQSWTKQTKKKKKQ